MALDRLVLSTALYDATGATAAWALLEPALGRAAASPARTRARALGLTGLASTLWWNGDLEAAAPVLSAAAEAAEADGCEYSRLSVLGQRALAAYHRGALREAASQGEEALLLGRTHGLPAQHRRGVAHVALAAVALEWNDRIGSLHHLDHADLTAQRENDAVLDSTVKQLRAHHHALDGRRALALSTVADARITLERPTLPSWMADQAVVTDAMVRLRCGDVHGALSALEQTPSTTDHWRIARAAVAHATADPATALELLEPILGREVPSTRGVEVEARVLAARIQLDEGDVPAARRALAEALRIGRTERRRRPFIEARAWLQPVLGADPELARASSWVGTGMIPTQRNPSDAVSVLVEPLTSRETAVLGSMAQVMSVAEIADDLHISVNTVKTHQRSLYRKLSVSRAHDAVRRGRDLELI